MEKGIVSDQSQQHDATMSKKEYCPDFCSWFFTKNDCTTNKTWNGLTCVWNASKQLCSSPEKPKPWLRNIVRTLLVVFTIVVLILILALQKDIVNAIKNKLSIEQNPKDFYSELNLFTKDYVSTDGLKIPSILVTTGRKGKNTREPGRVN